MAIVQLLPGDGVSFSNGIKIKISKDNAGEQGNVTLSLSEGPLAAVCAALNVPSLDIQTSLMDLVKFNRAITLSQSSYTLV